MENKKKFPEKNAIYSIFIFHQELKNAPDFIKLVALFFVTYESSPRSSYKINFTTTQSVILKLIEDIPLAKIPDRPEVI